MTHEKPENLNITTLSGIFGLDSITHTFKAPPGPNPSDWLPFVYTEKGSAFINPTTHFLTKTLIPCDLVLIKKLAKEALEQHAEQCNFDPNLNLETFKSNGLIKSQTSDYIVLNYTATRSMAEEACGYFGTKLVAPRTKEQIEALNHIMQINYLKTIHVGIEVDPRNLEWVYSNDKKPINPDLWPVIFLIDKKASMHKWATLSEAMKNYYDYYFSRGMTPHQMTVIYHKGKTDKGEQNLELHLESDFHYDYGEDVGRYNKYDTICDLNQLPDFSSSDTFRTSCQLNNDLLKAVVNSTIQKIDEILPPSPSFSAKEAWDDIKAGWDVKPVQDRLMVSRVRSDAHRLWDDLVRVTTDSDSMSNFCSSITKELMKANATSKIKRNTQDYISKREYDPTLTPMDSFDKTQLYSQSITPTEIGRAHV